MKLSRLLLSVALGTLALGASPAVWAGAGSDNGGDVAVCMPRPSLNSYSGMYFLDYLLTDSRKIVSSAELAKRVAYGSHDVRELPDPIRVLLREMTLAFRMKFDSKIFEQRALILSNRLLWRVAPNGLENVPDEKLRERLPENCRDVRQAVIREERGNSVVFHYDPKIISELVRRRQLNWLFLHEALWSFVDDAQKIREIGEEFFTGDTFSRGAFTIDTGEFISPGFRDRIAKGLLRNQEYFERLHADLKAKRPFDLGSCEISGRGYWVGVGLADKESQKLLPPEKRDTQRAMFMEIRDWRERHCTKHGIMGDIYFPQIFHPNLAESGDAQ